MVAVNFVDFDSSDRPRGPVVLRIIQSAQTFFARPEPRRGPVICLWLISQLGFGEDLTDFFQWFRQEQRIESPAQSLAIFVELASYISDLLRARKRKQCAQQNRVSLRFAWICIHQSEKCDFLTIGP